MIFITKSEFETINLGKKFSKVLKERDIVVLEGALGGGKTTFVKGVLLGLGLKEKVLSPSFTLIREYYKRDINIFHIDLYRLTRNDIFNLGIDEYIGASNSITFIEWGEKIKGILESYIMVKFLFLDQNKRKIFFSLKGYSKNKLKNLKI